MQYTSILCHYILENLGIASPPGSWIQWNKYLNKNSKVDMHLLTELSNLANKEQYTKNNSEDWFLLQRESENVKK
jgi:hypothetical protein